MGRILRKLTRFRLRSFDRRDSEDETQQPVENVDAWASTGGRNLDAQGGNVPAQFPPNYVPPADEGRPRH